MLSEEQTLRRWKLNQSLPLCSACTSTAACLWALLKNREFGPGLGCACGHAKLPQSCLTLCNPWTIARQAPLPMGFSRQEYWSGLPCPPPGDLPNPGIKPRSLMSPALGGGFFTTSATWPVRSTHHFPLHSQDLCLTDSRMTEERTYSV